MMCGGAVFDLDTIGLVRNEVRRRGEWDDRLQLAIERFPDEEDDDAVDPVDDDDEE